MDKDELVLIVVACIGLALLLCLINVFIIPAPAHAEVRYYTCHYLLRPSNSEHADTVRMPCAFVDGPVTDTGVRQWGAIVPAGQDSAVIWVDADPDTFTTFELSDGLTRISGSDTIENYIRDTLGYTGPSSVFSRRTRSR